MKYKNILSVLSAALILGSSANITAYSDDTVSGDVNGDGTLSLSDAVMLNRWLLQIDTELPYKQAVDLDGNNIINIFDLCLIKQKLMNPEEPSNAIYVTNTEELKAALAAAKPGDEIVLAEGEYVYSGSTPKGRMFTGEADGTEESPITLRSENPDNPSVISGVTTASNYGLTITGDWWIVKDIIVTNASKGIIVDNSNYTKLIGCEVYNIGSEGIHLRDNSSYCLVEECYVHDTGIVSPSYGEAVYVGSSKSTTGYGYSCDYNTIRNCRLGPNVAAEHVDVKEYTTGTIIEYCTFDGTGMSGENYADSFVNIKGNDCILRYSTGYRNGCDKINYVFDMSKMDEGWGRNAFIYGNKAYMDTDVNGKGGKMYFLNAWDCTATVWDNYIAYENRELFSVDDPDDQWDYYNSEDVTYGDYSIEESLRK
jgi:parallel beta-helix repeat protein